MPTIRGHIQNSFFPGSSSAFNLDSSGGDNDIETLNYDYNQYYQLYYAARLNGLLDKNKQQTLENFPNVGKEEAKIYRVFVLSITVFSS